MNSLLLLASRSRLKTGLSSGGATRFQGTISQPGTVQVNGQAATMPTATNFLANPTLPTGTNIVSVVATNGNNVSQTNRFQVVIPPGTAVGPSYDADGNMTNNGSGQAYRYDAENRLVGIVYSSGANSGNHTEMTYDGLGRRASIVERTGTSMGSGTITSTKQLLWVGDEIAEERNASSNVTKRFSPQGEQIAGVNYYFTQDHLGSTREMTNGSGAIQARYDYDSYGRTTLISGSNISDFQYASYYQHQISNLALTKFRAYDANTAKWLSRDPLGEGSDATLYSYVYNNPILLVDALGLTGANNVTATVFSTQNDPDNNGQLPAYTNQPINDNSTQGTALPASNLSGQYVQITNPANGNSVVVPVIDIGPGSANDPYWQNNSSSASNQTSGAGIDLTPATAAALGFQVQIVQTKKGPEWVIKDKNPTVNWKFVPKPKGCG